MTLESVRDKYGQSLSQFSVGSPELRRDPAVIPLSAGSQGQMPGAGPGFQVAEGQWSLGLQVGGPL